MTDIRQEAAPAAASTRPPATAWMRPEAFAPLAGIRFTAAGAVILIHSGGPFLARQPWMPETLRTVLANGYVAVTFFFVLSGFILQLIYSGRVGPHRHLRPFLASRLARLYPTYLLCLLLLAPFAGDWSWSALPQFLMLQCWAPQAINGALNWNGPAWTLSIEFFFYLVFPLLTPAVSRASTRSLVWSAAAIAAGIVTTGSAAVGTGPVRFDWLTYLPSPIARLPEFVLGMVAGQLFLREGWRSFPIPHALLMPVTWLILASGPAADVAGWVTVFSTLEIYALVAHGRGATVRFFGHRWLVLLGGASYALYLLAMPVHLAVAAAADGSKPFLLLQYPAVLIAALVVFFFYEEPMRVRIKRWIAGRC